MRGVYANAERKFRASLHDRAQMLETMADAFTLSGSILKQNLQLAETQAFACHLKTERTNLQRIFFRTAARAAGMHDEVIDTEGDRSFDFFTK